MKTIKPLEGKTFSSNKTPERGYPKPVIFPPGSYMAFAEEIRHITNKDGSGKENYCCVIRIKPKITFENWIPIKNPNSDKAERWGKKLIEFFTEAVGLDELNNYTQLVDKWFSCEIEEDNFFDTPRMKIAKFNPPFHKFPIPVIYNSKGNPVKYTVALERAKANRDR